MPNKSQKLYVNRNVTGSFSGLPAFAKSRGYTNYNQIKEDLQALDSYTLFKRIRLKYPRRRVRVFFEHYQYGLDLMQIPKAMAKSNSNLNYIMICIDNFSRFLYWAFLKSKSGTDVVRGLKKIFRDSKHYPRYFAILDFMYAGMLCKC